MDLELANRKRDRRLRRRILEALRNARSMSPRGGLGGRTVLDVTDGSSDAMRYQDDRHCLELCRSLVAKGYAAEQKEQRRRGETWGLDHVFFTITANGVSLLDETLPVDPDVDDERISE